MNKNKFSRCFLAALLFGICAVSVMAQEATKSKSMANPEKPPAMVPLVRILANPEQFDKKRVMTIGLVTYGFESQGIAMNREDAINGILINSLWIEFISAKNVDLEALSGKYCIIVGTFDAANRRHFSLRSGAIKNIERLDLWSDPAKAPRP